MSVLLVAAIVTGFAIAVLMLLFVAKKYPHHAVGFRCKACHARHFPYKKGDRCEFCGSNHFERYDIR